MALRPANEGELCKVGETVLGCALRIRYALCNGGKVLKIIDDPPTQTAVKRCNAKSNAFSGYACVKRFHDYSVMPLLITLFHEKDKLIEGVSGETLPVTKAKQAVTGCYGRNLRKLG